MQKSQRHPEKEKWRWRNQAPGLQTILQSNNHQNHMVQFGGWGNALGLWDGNAIKLGCDDHCTTINVINSLSNKKSDH